jgi:hypothetical protein
VLITDIKGIKDIRDHWDFEDFGDMIGYTLSPETEFSNVINIQYIYRKGQVFAVQRNFFD